MPDQQVVDEAKEVQLLKQARAGDAQAYGKLYELYAPRVLRFLFAHLDNRLDAEDLTEEIFLRVWRALPGYREQGVPFGGFLFRVARNMLIDHYRHKRRRQPDLDLVEERLEDGQADPAGTLQSDHERWEVHHMLRYLRRDYRTVLDLRFLADLSIEEIAIAMGKSPGAVRVLQHRALAALRKLMAQAE
ncbi:MAG: RNA polymerase sigma factor [Chloroflexota bacterium]